MKRNKWNEERLALLAELYPVETTPHTACVLGMSETAVKNMARRQGIAKRAKRKDTGRAGHIQAHFHERSFSEMAESLGISKTTVWRTASWLGLERTDAQHKDILSRTRREMIRRERRRAVFGLEPLTRIKVVTDRARVKLRSLLKSKGYVVDGGERNTLYFTAGTERLERLERRGERHGLRFLPFPCTDFLPYRPLTIKKHTAM